MKNIDKIPIHFLKDSLLRIYIERANNLNSFTPCDGGCDNCQRDLCLFNKYNFDEPTDASVFHRDEYYTVMLVMSGSIKMTVDFDEFEICSKSLFLTLPGQVHRIISEEEVFVWNLFFDPKLIDEEVKCQLDELIFQNTAIELGEDEYRWILNMMESLSEIFHKKKNAFKKQTMQALLDAVVYQVTSIYKTRDSYITRDYSYRSIEITKQFKKLLRKQYKLLKKPVDYADVMNVSIGYLNNSIRKVTGFSTSYHIQQKIIREAMRLLCYSELSIKEIAEMLKYEDTKYFYRLFKKEAGISAAAFKKRFRENCNLILRDK